MTREDVVQAALTIERWCAYHWKRGVCDVECPFIRNDLGDCKIGCLGGEPFLWGLEEFLSHKGGLNMTIEFTVPVRPVPMARPRVVRGHAYTPRRCADYKRLVAAAAKQAMRGRELMTGAVACRIELYYAIPKSYTCGKRLAAQYNRIKPVGRNTGDTDNHAKSIMDAASGICFADDAQITQLSVYKRFTMGGDMVRVVLTEDGDD